MISIVTPLFNRIHPVIETWESIKHQTYSDWEWIVVDDGSTDGSFEVVEEFSRNEKRIRLYKRPADRPKGPSVCRNYGAELSRGQYLIFLDSDDLLGLRCLERRIELMQNNINLDLAVFPMQCFSDTPGDDKTIFNRYLSGRKQYIEYFLTDRPPWQTMCPIWKKDAFQKLGGFNKLYTCMEDPELHVKALLLDYNFEIVHGDPDCYYRNSFQENLQKHAFWRNSIEGRIRFLKDMYIFLENYAHDHDERLKLISYLNSFLLVVVKKYMLARVEEYQEELDELLTWAVDINLIGRFQFQLISIAKDVYLSKKKWIKFIHLRGIVYRLL